MNIKRPIEEKEWRRLLKEFTGTEIILLDDVEPWVGDKLVIKIAGREELIKNSPGDWERLKQTTWKGFSGRCLMRILLDTNVLYSYLFETPLTEKATAILLRAEELYVSTMVLNELYYSSMRRKAGRIWHHILPKAQGIPFKEQIWAVLWRLQGDR
ncbi:PIN domain-containing protein [Thermococcus sp.]|uniref:type II toxin-antitoxin system VapC family toxin n=1 Tax=Thermococcus sp. TaxID=35749 RepID=UPI002623E2CE|nr:PIN domain-containing protein [Thermococcus sp.]